MNTDLEIWELVLVSTDLEQSTDAIDLELAITCIEFSAVQLALGATAHSEPVQQYAQRNLFIIALSFFISVNCILLMCFSNVLTSVNSVLLSLYTAFSQSSLTLHYRSCSRPYCISYVICNFHFHLPVIAWTTLTTTLCSVNGCV